jgi:hypothetical protein
MEEWVVVAASLLVRVVLVGKMETVVMGILEVLKKGGTSACENNVGDKSHCF